MQVSNFIGDYGYLAIAVATPFEGELALVLGGLAVHAGYLGSMYFVIAAAFVGALASDTLFFFLGHFYGKRLMRRYPRIRKLIDMPMHLIHRNPIAVTFIMRFLYGIRNIVPFAIGLSKVKIRTFFTLNIISAIVWSVVLSWLGYFFGEGLSTFFHRMKQNEFKIILIVAALFLIGHLLNTFIRFVVVRWSAKDKGDWSEEIDGGN